MTNKKHFWFYLYGFKIKELCILKVCISDTVYCTVQCTLVHVYAHIRKLSLRAAVVTNGSITASDRR